MDTNRFEEYLDDPDIVNLEMPLREIKAIRLMIFDDTKEMTFDERNAYFREGVEDICVEFNIELVASA
ncbi:MAG: hypothetical protein FWC09_07370 [Lachnospiraceae bacterium]|nr:hypothetical protein [Lachnospiraceae bacterium]